MEDTYKRLEDIYTVMTQQMNYFHQELNKLKNTSSVKTESYSVDIEKINKNETFTLEKAKNYLYTTNTKLRFFGYHFSSTNTEERKNALIAAIKYYGKHSVEKKILALITVWETNKYHPIKYVLLNHLRYDLDYVKSLP